MQLGFGAPVNGPLSGPRYLASIVLDALIIGIWHAMPPLALP